MISPLHAALRVFARAARAVRAVGGACAIGGAWLALAALTGLLAGCQRDVAPPLLEVSDLAPRDAEVGDRLELVGSGFPQGRTARVTFRGALHRPGEEPVQHAEVTTDGIVTTPQRVEVPFTEALEALFCGVGERAAHTTFTGDVEVAFAAAAAGAPPVAGTLSNVSLDMRPPSPRRSVVEAQLAEGDRVLAFLGLAVAAASPAAGGLLVSGVLPASRADVAGIAVGDVLTRLDGLRILSRADVIPSGRAPVVQLTVRRGDGLREETRPVRLEGWKPRAPAGLLGSAILLTVAAVVILLFVAPTTGAITWIERRVASRVAPRAAIEAALLEDFFPPGTPLGLGPWLGLGALSAVFAAVPFAATLVAVELDVGILYVLTVTALLTIALLTGGRAAGHRYSLVAGLRAAAQVVSYAVPAALALACVVMLTGSLRLDDIVRAQGPMPWEWYALKSPLPFLVFFACFVPATTGGSVRSTRRFVFCLAEWATIFVASGLGAALFLGGWQLPGAGPGQQDGSVYLQLVGVALFLAKAWFLVLAVPWVRSMVPRMAMGELVGLCWKILVPAALVAFAMTVGWIAWGPPPSVDFVISGATCAAVVLGALYVASRVRYHLRSPQGRVHLNPFL